MTTPNNTEDHGPLFGARFLNRLTAIIVGFAALTATISLAGRWYGESLAEAGHTTSTASNDIFIGQDHLRLPSNVIRFAEQRHTGVTERVDLYLTWPRMEGYSNASRTLFNDVDYPGTLIFLQISQSTMSRDMSCRIGPIYSHLFEGPPRPGPAGLMRRDMKQNSGYGAEVFFTGEVAGRSPYAVRCILPESPERPTNADCQRDFHTGRDLVVLYRFSSQLLPHWQAIDDSVIKFVTETLVP